MYEQVYEYGVAASGGRGLGIIFADEPQTDAGAVGLCFHHEEHEGPEGITITITIRITTVKGQ